MPRRTRICPQCKHKFKNYKWKRSWKYSGVAAACPGCGIFVYDWPKIIKEKRAKVELK